MNKLILSFLLFLSALKVDALTFEDIKVWFSNLISGATTQIQDTASSWGHEAQSTFLNKLKDKANAAIGLNTVPPTPEVVTQEKIVVETEEDSETIEE